MKDDFLVPDQSNDSDKQTNAAEDLRNNLNVSQFSREKDVSGDGDSTSFKSPEEVAEAEDRLEGEKQRPERSNEDDAPKKSRKIWRKNLTKKQKIILIVLLVVVLLGLLVAAWMWKSKKMPAATNETVAVKEEEPVKTTEPSKLSGREVALDVNKRQVVGVMIENSPDARPQSGLKDASVVFEAVAEGGVTRFLALFQDTSSDYIGPIRSARPYYIDWVLGFDGAYAHVGGSGDALQAIKTLGVKDLDQFSNPGPYQRVSSRYAPHNVYSSTAKLAELADSKGWKESTFTGFGVKADGAAPTPSIRAIDVSMSGFLYNPHWDYDQASNSYVRSQAGKPHMDEKSGQPITSKTVIVMVAAKGLMADRYHTSYATTGSGKAYIFQDGIMVEGTWTKKDSKSQLVFQDTTGKEIALNAGQRWITVVGAPTDVVAK